MKESKITFTFTGDDVEFNINGLPSTKEASEIFLKLLKFFSEEICKIPKVDELEKHEC